MARAASHSYERKLRKQLQGFLHDRGPHHAILSALWDSGKTDWGLFLFGGLLRDVFVLGLKQRPRDIDVVVANGSSEELAGALQPYIRKRTRFGGFQLELSRWHFDVWPLQATWAFVHDKRLAPSPQNLPKTTFLNVEAVAVSLGENGEIGDIFESGFFDAVHKRTLDINFEQNPYPALAAVRALATAARLQYSVSPRLANYIVTTERSLGTEALVSAQDSHYGFVRFRSQAIHAMVKHLGRGLDQYPNDSLHLPNSRSQQLTLWD